MTSGIASLIFLLLLNPSWGSYYSAFYGQDPSMANHPFAWEPIIDEISILPQSERVVGLSAKGTTKDPTPTAGTLSGVPWINSTNHSTPGPNLTTLWEVVHLEEANPEKVLSGWENPEEAVELPVESTHQTTLPETSLPPNPTESTNDNAYDYEQNIPSREWRSPRGDRSWSRPQPHPGSVHSQNQRHHPVIKRTEVSESGSGSPKQKAIKIDIYPDEMFTPEGNETQVGSNPGPGPQSNGSDASQEMAQDPPAPAPSSVNETIVIKINKETQTSPPQPQSTTIPPSQATEEPSKDPIDSHESHEENTEQLGPRTHIQRGTFRIPEQTRAFSNRRRPLKNYQSSLRADRNGPRWNPDYPNYGPRPRRARHNRLGIEFPMYGEQPRVQNRLSSNYANHPITRRRPLVPNFNSYNPAEPIYSADTRPFSTEKKFLVRKRLPKRKQIVLDLEGPMSERVVEALESNYGANPSVAEAVNRQLPPKGRRQNNKNRVFGKLLDMSGFIPNQVKTAILNSVPQGMFELGAEERKGYGGEDQSRSVVEMEPNPRAASDIGSSVVTSISSSTSNGAGKLEPDLELFSESSLPFVPLQNKAWFHRNEDHHIVPIGRICLTVGYVPGTSQLLFQLPSQQNGAMFQYSNIPVQEDVGPASGTALDQRRRQQSQNGGAVYSGRFQDPMSTQFQAQKNEPMVQSFNGRLDSGPQLQSDPNVFWEQPRSGLHAGGLFNADGMMNPALDANGPSYWDPRDLEPSAPMADTNSLRGEDQAQMSHLVEQMGAYAEPKPGGGFVLRIPPIFMPKKPTLQSQDFTKKLMDFITQRKLFNLREHPGNPKHPDVIQFDPSMKSLNRQTGEEPPSKAKKPALEMPSIKVNLDNEKRATSLEDQGDGTQEKWTKVNKILAKAEGLLDSLERQQSPNDEDN